MTLIFTEGRLNKTMKADLLPKRILRNFIIHDY
jgi:hypothetical protein